MVVDHNDLTQRIDTLLSDLREAESSNAVYREPALYLRTARKALGSIVNEQPNGKKLTSY
ncbi:hypothetical protein C9975_03510 [Thalassospira xiamenensis]|nr:hypothetical protein C9939_03840 [Pseudidiomarina aestuarii]PTC01183.1 hypothetical protein C9975_03510 [Thalassospira xiamenensis]